MSTIRHLVASLMLLAGALACAGERINLNAADAETLSANIVGIGPAKAAAIVAWREKHGPFRTVDDLLLVQGIGESTLEKNRDNLTAATP